MAKLITDVILELQALRKEYGDIEVIGVNEEEISFEFQEAEDGANSVIVAE